MTTLELIDKHIWIIKEAINVEDSESVVLYLGGQIQALTRLKEAIEALELDNQSPWSVKTSPALK